MIDRKEVAASSGGGFPSDSFADRHVFREPSRNFAGLRRRAQAQKRNAAGAWNWREREDEWRRRVREPV